MTPADTTAGALTGPASRRRSQRFPVVIPVEVSWQGPDGRRHQDAAQAGEANTHGGVLSMNTTPPVGAEIELTSRLSGETALARVVGLRRGESGAAFRVAVELVLPSESFWGVTFRLKKTTSELLKLEQAMQAGDLDLRALREFRDAVDHVRKTAWVVQEWRERQAQGKEAFTVLSMLTLERIRRATQLASDLATDLETHEVTRATAGLGNLLHAAERLYLRLRELLHGRK